jgi:Phytanoyl-CoA dioxygenase (PhyH)
MLTEAQWNDYSRDGFLHLGEVLTAAGVELLCQRADDLALGRIVNSNVQMQLDTGGIYEDLPNAVTAFERGTTGYRKIQGLEADEHFMVLLRHAVFREVCARIYGEHCAVSIFRAMVMNKPAEHGTLLPWHQDGGDVWALDRDPLVTIWVALDRASTANGCVEIIPGSHRLGLLSTFGSSVSDEDAARHCPAESVVQLEVEAGHAVLLHNWMLHRSGMNPSPTPRRAFTTCYMDGRTLNTLTGSPFPIVWGDGPTEPDGFVRQLMEDRAALSESRARAEEYALSLQETNRVLQASLHDATTYARSLESELARVRTQSDR